MRFGNNDMIKETIHKVSKGKYEIISNVLKVNEIIDEIPDIEVVQMKRKGLHHQEIKTVLFADISEIGSGETLKKRLKDVMISTAVIKENLDAMENVDLYLLLALPEWVSEDECIRIESTEQLCRKYVLMPDENIFEFLDRTFMSKIIIETGDIEVDEPITQALAITGQIYTWLTEDLQKEWKNYFMEYSNIDLVEKLMGKIDIGQSITKELEK